MIRSGPESLEFAHLSPGVRKAVSWVVRSSLEDVTEDKRATAAGIERVGMETNCGRFV
jgi:hypothetical protein